MQSAISGHSDPKKATEWVREKRPEISIHEAIMASSALATEKALEHARVKKTGAKKALREIARRFAESVSENKKAGLRGAHAVDDAAEGVMAEIYDHLKVEQADRFHEAYDANFSNIMERLKTYEIFKNA
ncbi:hypothetical protein HZC09_06435 [Candidatus Micrarchaeota archaeon]|nr:hypothetical protein [Candidatus Micrarchaeota archaeon]